LSTVPNELERDLAWYSAAVAGWIESRMERDRSLISLSAGGLGLLITILATVGPAKRWLLWLYLVAALAFLVTCLTCLSVFSANARHLEDLAAGKTGISAKLQRHDALSTWSFGFAITTSLAIALITALFISTHEPTPMADRYEDKGTPPSKHGDKSLSGIENLRPAPKPAPADTGASQSDGGTQGSSGDSGQSGKP
jgi:hypothetical protein